jgi:hypothetical protein
MTAARQRGDDLSRTSSAAARSRFRWAATRAIVVPLAAAAATFAAVGALLAWAANDKPHLVLDLEFSADACCSMQVWVNTADTADITVFPIRAGTRATYSLPLLTPSVERLRMPLGEVRGSSVTVHRIVVMRGDERVAVVEPAELRASTPTGAHARPLGAAVRFVADGRRPFLDVPVSLATGRSRARLFLVELTAQPLRWALVLFLAGVLAAAVVSIRSRSDLVFAGALACAAFAVMMIPRLQWRLPLEDDVSESVGMSSFTGNWKARERAAVQLAALGAIALPIAVAVVARWRHRLERRPRPDVVSALPRARSVRLALATVALPVGVVALATAPDLRSSAAAAHSVEYVPSWDANNLIFWKYLVQTTELAAMDDFFWPYGLQWTFNEALPWGPLAAFLGYLSLWALLATGVYVSLARTFAGHPLAIRIAALTAFWLGAVLAGYLPEQTRYIAPVALVLLFAAIDAGERMLSWRRLLFAAALFEVTLYEVAQTAYALPAIAVLALLSLAPHMRPARAELLRSIGRLAATVVVPLAAAAAVLAATEGLRGTVAYYAELDALVAAYGWPAPLLSWVDHPTELAGLLLWAFLATLAIGATGVVVARAESRRAYATVLALGVVAFMVMQKQVLRPPIEAQIWFPVVFGLVFWVVADTHLHATRRWTMFAVATAAAAAVAANGGASRSAWNKVTGGPSRVAATVVALVHERDELEAAAKANFAPARFARYRDHQPVVDTLRRDPTVRAGGRVWILGDDSPVTMMLGKSWDYYFSDLYDTSPIGFQKEVIDRLERNPPARVVWNFAPDAMVFDQVPHVVRVPLLFAWSVMNLAPREVVGTFAILRRLRRDEAPALDWWRRRIGSSISLGRIPEVATLPSDRCSSAAACTEYAVVEARDGHPGEVALTVVVGDLAFEVRLATPTVGRYVVPLGRLWFWAAAGDRPRSVRPITTPGIGLTIVRRARDDSRLY